MRQSFLGPRRRYNSGWGGDKRNKNSRFKHERRRHRKKERSPTDFKNHQYISATPVMSPAEKSVCWALDWLTQREVFSYWQQAVKCGERDQSGIDFDPYLHSGFSCPFQLKCRKRKSGRSKLMNRHLRKYPHVKLVVLLDQEDIVRLPNDEVKIRLVAKKIFNTIWPHVDFEDFFDISKKTIAP